MKGDWERADIGARERDKQREGKIFGWAEGGIDREIKGVKGDRG